jgi:hypothetical protein
MLNPLAPHDYTPARTTASYAASGSQRPFLSRGDIKQVTDPVENLILKYPGAALASAFFVGVLVAWLIKRK